MDRVEPRRAAATALVALAALLGAVVPTAGAVSAGGRALVVGVVGARGGAGATSFAVALSLAGARAGRRTMLVDLDPYGGGIDLVLGAEDVPGPRWDSFASGAPPVTGAALAESLPRCGEVTVLAWSRESPSVIPYRVIP